MVFDGYISNLHANKSNSVFSQVVGLSDHRGRLCFFGFCSKVKPLPSEWAGLELQQPGRIRGETAFWPDKRSTVQAQQTQVIKIMKYPIFHSSAKLREKCFCTTATNPLQWDQSIKFTINLVCSLEFYTKATLFMTHKKTKTIKKLFYRYAVNGQNNWYLAQYVSRSCGPLLLPYLCLNSSIA